MSDPKTTYGVWLKLPGNPIPGRLGEIADKSLIKHLEETDGMSATEIIEYLDKNLRASNVNTCEHKYVRHTWYWQRCEYCGTLKPIAP